MELKCGKTVPSRMYYLLDFNERDDWNYISEMFNASKLKKLDSGQFLELFYYATKSDMENVKIS